MEAHLQLLAPLRGELTRHRHCTITKCKDVDVNLYEYNIQDLVTLIKRRIGSCLSIPYMIFTPFISTSTLSGLVDEYCIGLHPFYHGFQVQSLIAPLPAERLQPCKSDARTTCDSRAHPLYATTRLPATQKSCLSTILNTSPSSFYNGSHRRQTPTAVSGLSHISP